MPLYSEELVGLEALHRLKDTLWADRDPAAVLYEETTMSVVNDNGQYRLDLYLPGIEKQNIELNKIGDELNIRIGNHRRNLVLPQSLAALKPQGAKFEDDHLRIRFAA